MRHDLSDDAAHLACAVDRLTGAIGTVRNGGGGAIRPNVADDSANARSAVARIADIGIIRTALIRLGSGDVQYACDAARGSIAATGTDDVARIGRAVNTARRSVAADDTADEISAFDIAVVINVSLSVHAHIEASECIADDAARTTAYALHFAVVSDRATACDCARGIADDAAD